ncbi:MAG: hypothetical protein HQK83_15210, partial [Fibrobacteria bacterium]|nr:hypothetical protein [Fibrobacteria bacterium]
TKVRRLTQVKKTALPSALLFFFLAFLFFPGQQSLVEAQTVPVAVSEGTVVSVENSRFNNIIQEVITKPEYSWRLPIKADKVKVAHKQTFLDKMVKSAVRTGKSALKKSKRVLKKIYKWIKNLLPEKKSGTRGSSSSVFSAMRPIIYILTGLLILVTLTCIVWIVFLVIKRKKEFTPLVIKGAAVPVDPEREDTTAEMLQSDEWFELASTLAASGKYRGAIRALFLSVLSALSQQNLIILEKNRSNREYENQLSLYGRKISGLPTRFSHMVLLFENVWYGKGAAQEPEYDNMIELARLIGRYAQQ